VFPALSAPQPEHYLGAMQYGGSENRLNPLAPEDADETTLGGYLALHGRAAAFQAADGRPYTVACDAEQSSDGGWVGYLVFIRWADTGTAIMGHLETGDLAEGSTEAEVHAALEAIPLPRVKQILDETVLARQRDDEAEL